MIELLIPLPNLYAAYTLSENNAYKTNIIYSFGYLPFIAYNLHINEFWQAGYFIINWVLAVKGVLNVKRACKQSITPELKTQGLVTNR